MHVDVVHVRAVAVDHDVVARQRVVRLGLHAPAARGHEPRAALGERVLALVGVARAPGAEAAGGAAEVVRAADREDVVVEVERVALGVAVCELRAVGRRRSRPSAGTSTGPAWRRARAAVPGDGLHHVRRHLLGVQVLTTVPSTALTSSTLSDVAERAREAEGELHAAAARPRRPWCGSCRSRARRAGPRGPGTGDSSGFGSGGSGGRIITGLVGATSAARRSRARSARSRRRAARGPAGACSSPRADPHGHVVAPSRSSR